MRQQNKQNVYSYLHTQYLEKKDKKNGVQYNICGSQE